MNTVATLIACVITFLVYKQIENISWDNMWKPGKEYIAKGVASSIIIPVCVLGPHVFHRMLG